MDKSEKELLEKRRKETSVKTMYFNRFLLIRYITAVFFFTNLYWFFSLIMSNTSLAIIPGVMLVFVTRAALEQSIMFSSPNEDAKKTRISFKLNLIINIALIISIFTPLFNELFPFLANSKESHLFILGIIFTGCIFCGVTLKRLQKIQNRTDKQFRYVKQYEKAIN